MTSTSARACEAIPSVCACSHEVVVGIDNIHAGQFVSVPFEHSLDGEAPHLQTEPGVFLEQVARCAAERARIGAACVGKFQGEIEEAGIFRRGKARPGSPLDVAKSKRIFFGSRPGYFLTIARKVARPVDEPFAARAYFS